MWYGIIKVATGDNEEELNQKLWSSRLNMNLMVMAIKVFIFNYELEENISNSSLALTFKYSNN